MRIKKALITFLKIGIFFVGWAVLSGVIDTPGDNPAVWRFFVELIPFVVMVLFTIAFLLVEKRTIKIPVTVYAGKGTVIGLAWIGISAGILIFTHQLMMSPGIIEFE